MASRSENELIKCERTCKEFIKRSMRIRLSLCCFGEARGGELITEHLKRRRVPQSVLGSYQTVTLGSYRHLY